MDEVLIIEASEIDIEGILRLYASADIDNGNTLTKDIALKLFRKMKSYPYYKLYVAWVGKAVVGTFTLAILDNIIHQGRPSGLVESVVVDENYRSRGIGKKMMEYAIYLCRAANCYKMCLSSNLKRERAHSFYERLGFIKHGYSFMIDL